MSKALILQLLKIVDETIYPIIVPLFYLADCRMKLLSSQLPVSYIELPKNTLRYRSSEKLWKRLLQKTVQPGLKLLYEGGGLSFDLL